MANSIIVLENGKEYLDNKEFVDLSDTLKEYDITLESYGKSGIMNSLYDICIYFNEHITELLITGVLIPTAYDAIKSSIKFIVFRIKSKVKIIQSDKVRSAQPSFRFKTSNGEVIAPIPHNLSEEQFDKYMDGVYQAIRALKPITDSKYERLIIEVDAETTYIETKSLHQYIQDQAMKKKRQEIESEHI